MNTKISINIKSKVLNLYLSIKINRFFYIIIALIFYRIFLITQSHFKCFENIYRNYLVSDMKICKLLLINNIYIYILTHKNRLSISDRKKYIHSIHLNKTYLKYRSNLFGVLIILFQYYIFQTINLNKIIFKYLSMKIYTNFQGLYMN
jgi:hypothetical protein